MRLLDFAQATRNALIERLPVKDRVMLLLQAVDRLAQEAIAAGDPDAFADDGQVLVARISLEQIQQVTGKSLDTVRRAISDARATPFLDTTDGRGCAYVFWLHWPEISKALPPPAEPPASCGGWHHKLRGVAPQVAGGGTPKTPIKRAPLQDPPQIPRDREQEINFLREFRELRDREHGGELLGVAGQHVGFFDGSRSDLLPWQRVDDEDLRGLDPRMLGVLYAEAVSRGWIPDTHDGRRKFLAIASHCAKHRGLENRRARVFVGRIRNRNARGLMDQAWDWSAEQMDVGRNPRGAGAHLDAAMCAKSSRVAAG